MKQWQEVNKGEQGGFSDKYKQGENIVDSGKDCRSIDESAANVCLTLSDFFSVYPF